MPELKAPAFTLMATINTLKGNNASAVGNKTSPNSISPHNVSDRLDDICDELLFRGAVQVADTATLPTVSIQNTRFAIVPGIGIFTALATGDAPDGSITFATADVGWLWLKVVTADSTLEDRFTITVNTSRDIPDGQKTNEFALKPTNDCTIRIGTTDGGEEVMPDKAFTAGQWDGVISGVYAEGADVPIYINFTGTPGSTKVIIYKRKL
jgi:hypothetical protein